MKKFFIVAMMAVVSLCVSAQQGQKAVGINLGVAPCLEDHVSLTNFGLGAKFQYNFTDPVRVEGAMDYWFESKGASMFDIAVNAHYLVNIGESGFRIYPLVGIGYANIGVDTYVIDGDSWDDYLDIHSKTCHYNRFLFNLGIGGEFNITDHLTLGAELKYQYINDFSRFPITVGLSYRF